GREREVQPLRFDALLLPDPDDREEAAQARDHEGETIACPYENDLSQQWASEVLGHRHHRRTWHVVRRRRVCWGRGGAAGEPFGGGSGAPATRSHGPRLSQVCF